MAADTVPPAMRQTICDNLTNARNRLSAACAAVGRDPSAVTLMAVTKTVPPACVNVAVEAGVTVLGENRVQEFLSKRDAYDPRATVQFIGHLQTNKVRRIVGAVSLIHSVDSLHLATAIDQAANACAMVQEILLEVNVGGEISKSGVAPDALPALLQAVLPLKNLRVRGLMVIPPPFADPAEADETFARVQTLFAEMQAFCPMDILSMGMSGDYEAAVRHGATIVRLGSALFGKRPAPQPTV